ncbi:MAG: LptF/LptG family permease, partial [Cyanobacteria bacterium P01_E01_bin.6]
MKFQHLILEKYLLASYIRPLYIGVLGGTILLSIEKLFGLATDLVVDGVNLLASLQVFILDIPSLFVQALPFAVLFSTLMTMRTLSYNGELVALQAAGVSYRKIAGPFVCVALTMSLLSFGISDSFIPLAQ